MTGLYLAVGIPKNPPKICFAHKKKIVNLLTFMTFQNCRTHFFHPVKPNGVQYNKTPQ